MFQYSLILVTLIAAQSFFENPYFWLIVLMKLLDIFVFLLRNGDMQIMRLTWFSLSLSISYACCLQVKYKYVTILT